MESDALLHIQTLMNLQESIIHYNRSYSKGIYVQNLAIFKPKKLWGKVHASLLSYYDAKITELYYCDLCKFISTLNSLPASGKDIIYAPLPRFLCIDSRAYLGLLQKPLFESLKIIKEDPHAFTIFIKAIDNTKKLDDKTLNTLADDIVFFILSDFSEVNDDSVNCLAQFKPKIYVSLIVT